MVYIVLIRPISLFSFVGLFNYLFDEIWMSAHIFSGGVWLTILKLFKLSCKFFNNIFFLSKIKWRMLELGQSEAQCASSVPPNIFIWVIIEFGRNTRLSSASFFTPLVMLKYGLMNQSILIDLLPMKYWIIIGGYLFDTSNKIFNV